MLGKMSEYMLKHMSWNVMVGITRNKIFLAFYSSRQRHARRERPRPSSRSCSMAPTCGVSRVAAICITKLVSIFPKRASVSQIFQSEPWSQPTRRSFSEFQKHLQCLLGSWAKSSYFLLPALLTDPQVLLFFCCRIARQFEVLHVSWKYCPSVRSIAR